MEIRIRANEGTVCIESQNYILFSVHVGVLPWTDEAHVDAMLEKALAAVKAQILGVMYPKEAEK